MTPASTPSFAPVIRVRECEIGPGRRTFVIAEAGVNHNGDLALARDLIDAAAAAGADAVKFQTFKADRLVSPAAPKAEYQLRTTDHDESHGAMLRRLELSEADHHTLIARCARRGVLFLSTPFDEESADFLAGLDVAAFKTSSGDLTNLPFLAHLARLGRPVILSTGMSHLAEVEDAMRTLSGAGAREVAVLHCVSDYPTHPADANLRAMDTLASAFGAPVGFSDHTLGTHIAVAAVARGACVIEKHLTLDRTLPGPDHRASLEPAELAQMIAAIRDVESAIGDGMKTPRGSEIANIIPGRKSLHWSVSLPPGTVVSAAHFVALRPGSGISPARLPAYLGRRTSAEVHAGQALIESDLVP